MSRCGVLSLQWGFTEKTHVYLATGSEFTWTAWHTSYNPYCVNSSPPRQIGGKIPNTIFSHIFHSRNDFILIKIPLNFVPKGSIDDTSTLVQVMAWRRRAKSHYLIQGWPSTPTHTCGTRIKIVCMFYRIYGKSVEEPLKWHGLSIKAKKRTIRDEKIWPNNVALCKNFLYPNFRTQFD